jgi:hypothetical protein
MSREKAEKNAARFSPGGRFEISLLFPFEPGWRVAANAKTQNCLRSLFSIPATVRADSGATPPYAI